MNGEQVMIKLQEWVALYGIKVLAAVFILIVGLIAAKTIRSILRRVLKKAHIDDTLVSFISSLT